jgi:hypothetical protein
MRLRKFGFTNDFMGKARRHELPRSDNLSEGMDMTLTDNGVLGSGIAKWLPADTSECQGVVLFPGD